MAAPAGGAGVVWEHPDQGTKILPDGPGIDPDGGEQQGGLGHVVEVSCLIETHQQSAVFTGGGQGVQQLA